MCAGSICLHKAGIFETRNCHNHGNFSQLAEIEHLHVNDSPCIVVRSAKGSSV